VRLLLLVGVIHNMDGTAGAQTAKLSDAPGPHRFMDRTNLALISGFALAITGDGVSTQKFLSRGYQEQNPLMRKLVTSRKGAAFGTGIAFTANVGIMDYLHRKGHHGLERIYGWTVVAVEAGLTGWNYSLAPQFPDQAEQSRSARVRETPIFSSSGDVTMVAVPCRPPPLPPSCDSGDIAGRIRTNTNPCS
jgi:hypothetical protein